MLMALLDLLRSGVIRALSCELLVLFFLSLLKFLPVFFFPGVHLFLLLLVFLVLLRVPRVWRRGTLERRKIIGMDGAPVIFRRIISSIAGCGISRTAVDRAALSSRHDSAIIECPGSGGSSDGRLAAIYRRA